MSETTWRHIRTALNQRTDREKHEAALADAADQVLRRSRPLTGPAPATPAGTAGPPAKTLPAPHPAEDAEDSLDAVDAHTHDDDDSEAGGEEPSLAGRFALYDASEEAEHW